MGSLLTDTGKDGRVTVFDTEQSTDRMGDARPEGERNFWNGTESVTARGPAFNSQQTLNIKEAEELRFEGGSDIFTSNRHQKSLDWQKSSNSSVKKINVFITLQLPRFWFSTMVVLTDLEQKAFPQQY